jgi:hypothetical protein
MADAVPSEGSPPPPQNGEGTDWLAAVTAKIQHLNAELQAKCEDIGWTPVPDPIELRRTQELVKELVQHVQHEVIEHKDRVVQYLIEGEELWPNIVETFQNLKQSARRLNRVLYAYEQTVQHHLASTKRREQAPTDEYARQERAVEREGSETVELLEAFRGQWTDFRATIIS